MECKSLAQDAANVVIKNVSHIKKSNFIIKKELKYLENAIFYFKWI